MAFIKVVDTRGRLIIPVELRRKYGLMGHMRVSFREVDGRLVIEPAKSKDAGVDQQPSSKVTRSAALPRD